MYLKRYPAFLDSKVNVTLNRIFAKISETHKHAREIFFEFLSYAYSSVGQVVNSVDIFSSALGLLWYTLTFFLLISL